VKNEIIFLSERSGWKHLYAFNIKSKKWRAITKGEWEIHDVSRVDADAGWIYFTAGERSPISTDWLRVRIDGSEQQRLTSREGSHRQKETWRSPVGAISIRPATYS
jgi:dipeptidyl-peptidase-4